MLSLKRTLSETTEPPPKRTQRTGPTPLKKGLDLLHAAVDQQLDLWEQQRKTKTHQDNRLIQEGGGKGDAIMNDLRHTLSNMGLVRHRDQVAFHEMFLNAIAEQIYGKDIDTDYQRILSDNQWDNLKPQSFIVTPRRWGKTTCTAMFCAAYMRCVPGKRRICVFSTSRRVSEMFLEQVHDFMLLFPDVTIIKKTHETIWVKDANHPQDIRKFFSYPSNPKIKKKTHPRALPSHECTQSTG